MATTEPTDVYKTMDLALRIGELLLSCGAGAADVSAQMNNVARACGLRRFSADVTFTELAMSHQPKLGEPAIVQLRQVRRRVTDFGDLTEVDLLVRDLVAERVDRDDAIQRLNRIVSTGHSRPRWSVTLGLGVLGAGVGMTLGGGPLVVAIAFIAAVGIDVIQLLMNRRRLPAFYQQVAGGLFATLLAASLVALGVHLQPGRVIIASIILLLAGVSFLGAIQDALTGFPLTAAARILEALIATAGVIGGVTGGFNLARVLGVGLGKLDPGGVQFAGPTEFVIGAAVTASAYAFAAYAPWRSLIPIAAMGAGAAGTFVLAYRHDVGIAWAEGVAALTVGLVGYAVSGLTRVPALVVMTAAIVPLLPGLSIYRALAVLGGGGGPEAGSRGLLAMATAGAIAIALSSGVILGEYVAQPLKREALRLESKLAGPRLVGPITIRAHRIRRRRRPK